MLLASTPAQTLCIPIPVCTGLVRIGQADVISEVELHGRFGIAKLSFFYSNKKGE